MKVFVSNFIMSFTDKMEDVLFTKKNNKINARSYYSRQNEVA
jgi:hypothetical protein